MRLEQRALVPRAQGLVDVRVDAGHGDAAEDVGGPAVERVAHERREHPGAVLLEGDLGRAAGRQDRQALSQRRPGVVGRGRGAQPAAVAAVDDHHDLADMARAVRERQHVPERDALLVRGRVRRDQVAPEVVLRAVAGEVQERHVGRVAEQRVDRLAQPGPGDVLVIGHEQLRVEVHRSVVVTTQQARHRARVVDAALQPVGRVVVDADQERPPHGGMLHERRPRPQRSGAE